MKKILASKIPVGFINLFKINIMRNIYKNTTRFGKSFALFFAFVVLMLNMGSEVQGQTVTIGSGISVTYENPLNVNWGYNYTQQIYTGAEISAGGVVSGQEITAIRFYWNGNGNLTNSNTWVVYLGNTAQSIFANATNWVPSTSLTQVYNGGVALPGAAGWMTITLATPYIWTGGNIVVAIDENVVGYGHQTTWRSTSTAASNTAIYFRHDSNNPDPTNPPSGTISPNRPNLQLEFNAASACSSIPAPGNTIASANPVCAGIPFILSLENITSGSGVSYQWQSSPDGFLWTDITGATSLTYTTTQSTATHYQCVVTCATFGSASSNPIKLTMSPPLSCYCIPSGASSYNIILDFSTTGGSTNITNNGSGYSVGGYGDFTGMTVTQVQNSLINFSATFSTAASSIRSFEIFVDWNQSGSFEPTERVFNTSSGSDLTTVSGSFTVPVSALPGNTRMRIIGYKFQTEISNPCGLGIYGEFEDYTLEVIELPCTGTPNAGTASISSTSGCSSTPHTVSATGLTVATGLVFQWQSSPDNSTWTDIPHANSTSYNNMTDATTYYRLVTTCTYSGQSNQTNVVSYTVIGDDCCLMTLKLYNDLTVGWGGEFCYRYRGRSNNW